MKKASLVIINGHCNNLLQLLVPDIRPQGLGAPSWESSAQASTGNTASSPPEAEKPSLKPLDKALVASLFIRMGFGK